MGYILGLDIGIASIGWSILDVNEECEPFKINNLGVRIFESAEHPKNGAALALPRREARGARRRIRRKRHRLQRIKSLLKIEGLVTKEQLEKIYDGSTLADIYKIRYEALERRLTNEEFTRLLIHLAQRRGFKSNRKKQISKEDGKLLEAINGNKQLLVEKGYRTVGEMLYKDEVFRLHKRNTTENYLCTTSRDMMEQEIKTIFEEQRAYKNEHTTQELEEKYLDIYLSQRSFDEGPGGRSRYRNPLEKMIGYCTFEPKEKRAAKASFTYEYFVLLNQINNIRITSKVGGIRQVNPEEKERIIEAAYKKTPLKYSDIRKVIELKEEETFKAIYIGNKNRDEVESKNIFAKMEAYHTLRKALDNIEKGHIRKLSWEVLDDIAYATTLYKTDEKIGTYLQSKEIDREIINTVQGISFSKVGHLSLKAMQKIIPYLEEGMAYNEACDCAGYNFNQIEISATKKEFIESISNPVVRRSVSQSIKVIDAIIRQYGAPARVHIELARDMSRNFSDRKKIEKAQGENRATNEKLVAEISNTYGYKANGQMLLKYKLWREQDGRCMYSGKYIDPDRLFQDATYTDIDHIIPYSKCFDDSYANKTLVLSGENRQKTNQTPYEYMKHDEEKWRLFEERVRVYIRNVSKQQKLLKKHIDEEDENNFKERNLNDTRYITKVVSQYLKQYITFDDRFDFKKKVIDVNGAITAYCRKRWGLSKVRENGDLHHALDAVVIACVTDGMIQKVTKYHQIKEDELVQNIPFPAPWEKFREELTARLEVDPNIMIKNCNISTYKQEVEPIFVSRMPRRKNTGSAHQETLRGGKLQEDGIVINRTPITKLQLDSEGEIKGYYNKQANIELYEALRDRLRQHGGKGEVAFKEPFYKTQKPSITPVQVKKVRTIDKATLVVPLNQGNAVAANGSMVRIDIFVNQGKYFIVPIYMNDIVNAYLPNRAVVANKSYDEWPVMDENYQFLFTLYPNDLIYVKHNKGIKLTKADKSSIQIKEGFVYYNTTNIATGAIKVKSHDGQYSADSLGVKTLAQLIKYQVDVLGERQLVKKEQRLDYTIRKNKRG